MKSEYTSSPKPADAWHAAGEPLAREGNRLLLIEALLLCIMPVGLYASLGMTYALLSQWVSGAWTALTLAMYAILLCLLTLLVMLPLLIGYMGLARKVTSGEAAVLADLLEPFSSSRCYRHTLRLAWGAMWRMLCVVSAVAATCGMTVHLFSGSLLAGLLCGVAVAVEVLVWLLLVMRRFFVLAASAAVGSVKRAPALAHQLHKSAPRAGIAFLLYSLPRLLLGVLTIGIYLLWEALPRMSVGYFLYSGQHIENIRSEEYKRS